MDLNLFVAFEALMETRNTVRAGERLGLSQPATSAALGRLRQYFGDQLLVHKGRQMYPTPFAESLLPRIRACLRDADVALSTSDVFEASKAERLFRIVASDYVVATVLAPMSRSSSENAPGIRFDFILPSALAEEQLRQSKVDLVIQPADYSLPHLPTEPLYDEPYVIAGCRDHPIFRGPVTTDAIFSYGHIALSVGDERSASVGDKQLDLLGFARRVEMTAASFAVLPWLLIGTQRLTLMQQRLARSASEHFAIAHVPLPFRFAPIHLHVQYHETRTADQGVRWLINEIRSYATGSERPATN